MTPNEQKEEGTFTRRTNHCSICGKKTNHNVCSKKCGRIKNIELRRKFEKWN